MDITIKTIPHHKQRYDTVGDWFFDKHGNLEIRVSDLGDVDQEALVAVHELVEVLLCQKRGISQAAVDRFDKKFEKDRFLGLHKPDEEPGDDPKAPYRKEHCFATKIERLLCRELGVNWDDYAAAIEEL